MTHATQQELTLTHNNEFLFSNHYLNNRLPKQKIWRETDEYQVELVFELLRKLWMQLDPNGLNEAQTEERWIKPVLDALGHFYSVQVSIETPRTVRQPDYVLAADTTARNALRGVLSESDLVDALAVADAKKWDRDLDTKGSEGTQLSNVPSLQIDQYLRYSGVDWGILTNGRKWRLYHRETSHKLDVFYEIDLPQLLEQGSSKAFRYFLLFFRREAFGGETPFLKLVLEESKAYEHGISEDLKSQVYDALVSLGQGFFDLESNKLTPDENTLQAVHDSSLIVLYRLLFLLFAESRGLLPMKNRKYRDQYSLEHLKKEIRDEGRKPLGIAGATNHWSHLRNLWRFVDQGQSELGIPPYNGGLFKPDSHPFLEKYEVGDRHLAKAVDLLARAEDPRTGTREFVDYRDLEVRHLGSIYEGLLEYKLRYSDEPLSVDSSGAYMPTEAGNAADVRAEEVYLVTDKGERKATGSYYTPDYIVQYIVERTVGPLLQHLRKEHTDENGELFAREELVQKVLDINVLDPAMGSGHFLVDVTDFIARFLVEVSPELVETDTADETELAFWRRRVAQACVYGVDINPLAVELAKLSLWLRAVAKDKPLSFLDHHLRRGNSLVGAHVRDLPLEAERTDYQKRKEREARRAGQESLMDTATFQEAMSSARGLMDRIEDLAGDKLEEVQEAAHLYEELVEEHTRVPRLIANVLLAQNFGLDVKPRFLTDMVSRLRDGSWQSAPQYSALVDEASKMAEDLGFFHWELEFPEVFFGEGGELAREQAGFDAVIGNPPYVRMERFKPLKPYLREEYEVHDTRTDLYVYFMEKSVRLSRAKGMYGVIVSNKWLRSDYGTGIREFLLRESAIRELIDFRDLPVFGAVTYPLILLCEKATNRNEAARTRVAASVVSELAPIHFLKSIDDSRVFFNQKDLATHSWALEGLKLRSVLSRISSYTKPLHEYVGFEPLMGIKTGLNDAFIVDEATRDRLVSECPEAEEIILPVCTGAEVRRYHLEWEQRYLIYTDHGTDMSRYPVVLDHLRPYRERLESRATEQEWYELQQPQGAYEPFFRGAKILNPDLAEKARFFLDDRGFVTTNKVYFLPTDDYYLLGLLNSSVVDAFLKATSTQYRGGYLQLLGQFIQAIPVPEKDREAQIIPSEFQTRLGMGEVTFREAIASQANKLTRAWKVRQRLSRALDPFKYLNRGVAVRNLRDVFRDEIKLGEQVHDLGCVHHDVDGLALTRDGKDWNLRVLLKRRDEETGWSDWVKDGHEIVREWVTAYRFTGMPKKKAVYYQNAFEVFDDFEHSGKFPGGKTRTTKMKLDLTKIAVFDTNVDLDALLELTEELADVGAEIAETDEFTNRLVYELYGLSEDEIAVVEGRSAG